MWAYAFAFIESRYSGQADDISSFGFIKVWGADHAIVRIGAAGGK
jgi:hypothetical protein